MIYDSKHWKNGRWFKPDIIRVVRMKQMLKHQENSVSAVFIEHIAHKHRHMYHILLFII